MKAITDSERDAMEDVVSATGKLQKQLGEIDQGGGKGAAAALERLNIQLEDLRALSPAQAFMKVGGALGEVGDASEQAAIGAALFGKGWQSMLPLIQSGEEGMPIGSFMSVVQDAPRTRDYVFSPETIVAGTLTIGYNFDGTDEPDHLEVIYTDPDSMADARVYYPSKGARPEVVEIFGCTSPAHATAWAKLTWQERQFNRKTVQFELEGEGYLINPLTRFGVAVPNVDWGSGGVVLQWDAVSKEVQLDTPYPQGVNTIYFKSEATGKLLAPSTITARISDYHLRLAAAPAEEIHGSDETGDATRWVSTGDDRLFFEFNVTDLEPTGPMRVKVTGTQYTAEKYAGTFVSNWVT